MDIERLAGTKLGNYEIESLLGRGGMGVVYKALQVNLDRPVALKILPPYLSSDASFVKRFKREARAVAKLSHSNIIQIFDITKEQNLHFFSMEYVEGKTLDKVLKEKGKLEPSEAISIISQAARAIEHAHENEILHRDIKPSNIILDRRSNVKVMDFGLARMTDDRSKLTQSGTLVGTLDYMSPEQCRGEELDERTDIYSLGVVLFEMLTGSVPFETPNEAALIHKIISENPPEVRTLNPGVPASMSTLISRTMEKEKDKRHPSISGFIKDIQGLEMVSPSIAVAGQKSKPSIAVLPFVDMSPQKDQEYFCDGMAETLINELTHIEDLKVIARTSAFSFKGKNVNVREIGRELDVETILEGSVQKAGNRFRITAQLVSTAAGHHLWSEKYDRDMEDIFAIQDEITEAIVGKLKPKLLGEEKARIPDHRSVDVEAYNLYLKGIWFLNKQREDGLRSAIEYFEKAIEIVPDYALAYAGLARAYFELVIFSPSDPKIYFPKAKEAATRALEIDDALPEAHVVLAGIKSRFEWDWEEGINMYRRAITLNPGCAHAHTALAMHFHEQGQPDKAIKEILRALELDPLSLDINRHVGEIFAFAGQYERAIEAFENTLELDPTFSMTHLALGIVYTRQGKYKKALEEFEREWEISKTSDLISEVVIAVTRGFLGRRDEAQKVLDDLLERSKHTYVPPYFVANLYFVLLENDRGFEWLEKAYEEKDFWLPALKVGHFFSDILNLRSDPRYIAMLKKMNLDK